MAKGSVAIIGGGIGGLAVARYLKSQGFAPEVFESHSDIGGQWNATNPHSGVWPTMRTNTAGFATKLSDVQYGASTKVFPYNTEVLGMIRDMVRKNGLEPLVRCGCEVTALARHPGGYELEWITGGARQSRVFDRAVVASGRFIKPEIPAIAGIESFSGVGGVTHSHRYKDPLRYRDMNIVVLGGSISSMEVASDQALMGTGRIYLSQRRQRYVMPKMFAGVPLEYYAFTLEGAMALDSLSREELLQGTKAFLEIQGGNPARYGAPAPHADMALAGITGSQHFLNLVAEDRIDVRPWVTAIVGDRVTFADGTEVQADAIIVGTGFDLHLPFLSDEIAGAVRLTKSGMELMEFTFHPDLPGLAFVGLWAQLGPYPVVLEQQARWIAYAWGGAVEMPSEATMREGVRRSVADGHHDDYRHQHEMALRFGRLAGVMPEPGDDAELALVLGKSPVLGETFRISGPDADPNAAGRIKELFWRYAPIPVQQEVAATLGRNGTDATAVA